MLIALAVLSVVLYVALRRARPRSGYTGVLAGLPVEIVESRYLRPGDMIVVRRDVRFPPVLVGPITVGIDPARDGSDGMVYAVRAHAEARVATEVADPTRFVRITGV